MAALKLQTTSSNETATNQTRALADSLLKGPRRDRWREKKPPIFFFAFDAEYDVANNSIVSTIIRNNIM